MKKNKNYSVIIFSIIIITACNYFNLMSHKEWRTSSDNNEIEIFIAGYRNNSIACYWKTDKNDPIDLENGSPGRVYGLEIYGNDVYLCGSYNGILMTDNEKACYWKNGDFHQLECPESVSLAFNIDIVNDNIYICGYYGSSGSRKACYWINGEFHALTSSGNNTMAISIDVEINELSQSQIYISGLYTDTDPDDHACYWNNENFNSLPDSETGASRGLGISNFQGNLIVGGTYTYSARDEACYWTNGSISKNNDLDAGDNSSHVYEVKIIKNKIYFLGAAGINTPAEACYWKNYSQTLLPLPSGGSHTSATSNIASIDNDYYICGNASIGANIHATWWKNDKNMGFLEDYGLNESNANSIGVKYKN